MIMLTASPIHIHNKGTISELVYALSTTATPENKQIEIMIHFERIIFKNSLCSFSYSANIFIFLEVSVKNYSLWDDRNSLQFTCMLSYSLRFVCTSCEITSRIRSVGSAIFNYLINFRYVVATTGWMNQLYIWCNCALAFIDIDEMCKMQSIAAHENLYRWFQFIFMTLYLWRQFKHKWNSIENNLFITWIIRVYATNHHF